MGISFSNLNGIVDFSSSEDHLSFNSNIKYIEIVCFICVFVEYCSSKIIEAIKNIIKMLVHHKLSKAVYYHTLCTFYKLTSNYNLSETSNNKAAAIILGAFRVIVTAKRHFHYCNLFLCISDNYEWEQLEAKW